MKEMLSRVALTLACLALMIVLCSIGAAAWFVWELHP